MEASTHVVPVTLELIDGQPTTTSLDVAQHFGKLHKDVLKRITNLDCSQDFTQRNFAPCNRPGSNNKPEPFYRMTRDGFTFLCMGFTGKEAAKWKEAYINAFNQLEQDASQASLPAPPVPAFQQRAFRGCPILLAEIDGKPWFSAGNICTALSLGSSDRVVRSLVTHHKRKLRRGNRELWMVDAVGARRAAEYSKAELAGEYRQWLHDLLAELEDRISGGSWSGESDVLQTLSLETQQLLTERLRGTRFLMSFDFAGEVQIKAIDPTTAMFRQDELAYFIRDPNGASHASLPGILEAVSHRMKLAC